MNIKEVFGKNLKFYRFQRGFSQEKLAEIMDSTVSYISNIETGRNGVSFATVEELCRILNIRPKQLFDDKIEKKTISTRLDLYRRSKYKNKSN